MTSDNSPPACAAMGWKQLQPTSQRPCQSWSHVTACSRSPLEPQTSNGANLWAFASPWRNYYIQLPSCNSASLASCGEGGWSLSVLLTSSISHTAKEEHLGESPLQHFEQDEFFQGLAHESSFAISAVRPLLASYSDNVQQLIISSSSVMC